MRVRRLSPFVGPEHPFTSDGKAIGAKNHRSGHVEDTHLNDYNFDDQYNTFHRCRSPRRSAPAASCARGTPPWTGKLPELPCPASNSLLAVPSEPSRGCALRFWACVTPQGHPVPGQYPGRRQRSPACRPPCCRYSAHPAGTHETASGLLEAADVGLLETGRGVRGGAEARPVVGAQHGVRPRP